MFSNIKNISIEYMFPLSTISQIKIGGRAKYYIVCNTQKALIKALKTCLKNSIKFKLIGGCSNILFDDRGFNGAIIKLNFNKLKIKKNRLICSSDLSIGKIISELQRRNLSGMENFIGIPACVGGAIFNNMGAFENEISKKIIKIKYLKINNKINLKLKIIKNTDFSYRKCNFLNKNDIILFSEFKLIYSDLDSINLNLFNYFNHKKSTQPLSLPSLGSVFKRGDYPPPALLIEQLKLKGLKIGGAEISTKHSGFIVNSSNATCKDVLALVDFIKQKVKQAYNIDLVEEIEYLPY